MFKKLSLIFILSSGSNVVACFLPALPLLKRH